MTIPDHLQVIDFNKKLKSWYLKNHRPLLWRQTNDPYKIWMSEIILQQTRVAQGTPYYERFLLQFPTIFDLAGSDERDVLRLWQGLGYYSRARNMHFTARQIVADFDGKFPETAARLTKLKGLGQYTAAAIASFAFGEPVAAIDGNVYRVMARLFGIHTDILSNDGKKQFAEIAAQLVPEDDPGTYNQAMIEFGAIQCVPVAPACNSCPFADICYALEFNMQAQLPVKAKKNKVQQRYFDYFIIRQNGQLAMRERLSKDIWRGLYDFYLIESDIPATTFDDLLYDEFVKRILQVAIIREIPKVYGHILSHQKLNVRFWALEISLTEPIDLPPGLAFYSVPEVEDLPKPILIDMVLKEQQYL